MIEKLLTKKGVAEKLGVSEAWVQAQMKAGRLPYLKLTEARNSAVRFREVDVMDFLDGTYSDFEQRQKAAYDAEKE